MMYFDPTSKCLFWFTVQCDAQKEKVTYVQDTSTMTDRQGGGCMQAVDIH